MADQTTRSRSTALAGSPAGGGAARGRPRPAAQDFRRRRARRRQDLRDAAAGARRARRDGYDVVVGVVETHGRKETEALLEGLEIIPRQRVEYKGQCARGDGPRRHPRAPAADRPGRRARPHQRAGQPPSQALSRRRGAARRRHRRLYHGQHPAYRKPERRRGADHRMCACARPCRTRSSTAPTTSSWSTSRPTT